MSSIAPLFAKPDPTIRFDDPPAFDPNDRSTDPGTVLSAPVIFVVPCAMNVPEFKSVALTVPDIVVIVP